MGSNQIMENAAKFGHGKVYDVVRQLAPKDATELVGLEDEKIQHFSPTCSRRSIDGPQFFRSSCKEGR